MLEELQTQFFERTQLLEEAAVESIEKVTQVEKVFEQVKEVVDLRS